MTYGQLINAYYLAVSGRRAPILIGLNSRYCDWWVQLLLDSALGLRGQAVDSDRVHREADRIRRTHWSFFHGAGLAFRPEVPEGVVRFWFADGKFKEIKLERQGTKRDNTLTLSNQS